VPEEPSDASNNIVITTGAIMTRENVLAIIRHLLTSAGGALVANGMLTATQLQDGVGAVIVLIGIGWSLFNKLQHRRALAAAMQNRN
jgi:hypothetical protein